jgi:hypothetical protein
MAVVSIPPINPSECHRYLQLLNIINLQCQPVTRRQPKLFYHVVFKYSQACPA